MGRQVAAAFEKNLDLPAVIVTGGAEGEGAGVHCLSRGQYLSAIARRLGPELYHPRPIRVMIESLNIPEPPLILPADTRVQDATRQCLQRHNDLLYEPFLVRDPATEDKPEQLAVIDFQDLLMADSRVSSLRNQQMANILTTVREGLLMVDPDFRIAPEYSREAERIFAQSDLGDCYFPDILREVTDDDTAERGEDYLRTLFNPNVIEKLITKINPLREIAVACGEPGESETTKYLRFGFLRSMEAGEIRRVLVRVEDVTRQVLLAKEVEEQEKRARQRTELTFHLVRAEPEPLREFLKNLDRELAAAADLLKLNGESPTPAEVRDQLFRTIHGLKGEAALLGLPLHQQRLHDFEDHLQYLKKADLNRESLRSLQPKLLHVRELVEESRGLIEQFRRLSGPTTESQEAGEPARSVADAIDNNGLRQETGKTEILPQIERLVADLCGKHNRQARFVSHTPEAEFPSQYRPLLRDLLVQLVRNSIVHGIETPDERIEAEKPLVGELQFAIRDHPGDGQIELIFQDDGRGLQPEKLARKAEELNFTWETEEDLYGLIFESGFSTAETLSEDAGRGVGMDLLRDRIGEAGGLITPFSDPGVFCAFQVLLPRPTENIEPFAGHETADC